MAIKWNSSLSMKAGQDVKEDKKTNEIEVIDKAPEFVLAVKATGEQAELSDVMDGISILTGGTGREINFKISGTRAFLENTLKQITKIIAEAGGQETLDIFVEA